MVAPLGFADRRIIDACDSHTHQPVLIEFPVLITVASIPLPRSVVPLVGEAHGNAILTPGPNFFDKPVVKFTRPLAHQERLDGISPL